MADEKKQSKLVYYHLMLCKHRRDTYVNMLDDLCAKKRVYRSFLEKDVIIERSRQELDKLMSDDVCYNFIRQQLEELDAYASEFIWLSEEDKLKRVQEDPYAYIERLLYANP